VALTLPPQFGLGIGAATLWIRHKERCRERERYLTTGVPGTMSEQERWKWQHGWYRSVPTQAQTSTHPQSQNHINEAHPIVVDPRNFATPTPANPNPNSQPIAPLASTTAYPTTTTTTTPNPPEQDSTRRWGYSYRRARRLEAERERERERAAAASAATEVPLPTTTSGLAPTDSATSLPTSQAAGASASGSIGADEEMRKLREAVEALWAEKKRGVVEAQEKANEQVCSPLGPLHENPRDFTSPRLRGVPDADTVCLGERVCSREARSTEPCARGAP
jgi:hypothetical protein